MNRTTGQKFQGYFFAVIAKLYPLKSLAIQCLKNT